MPRQEIQRQRIATAARKKIGDQSGGAKLTVANFTRVTKARAADFEFWKPLFDFARCRGVEVEKLFIRAGPHHGPVLRLIPDFPIADVQIEAIGPAFVVMANDP